MSAYTFCSDVGSWYGADNTLTGSISPAIGQLKLLRILFMSNNRFQGSLPPDLFVNFTSIMAVVLVREQGLVFLALLHQSDFSCLCAHANAFSGLSCIARIDQRQLSHEATISCWPSLLKVQCQQLACESNIAWLCSGSFELSCKLILKHLVDTESKHVDWLDSSNGKHGPAGPVQLVRQLPLWLHTFRLVFVFTSVHL